LYLGIKDHQGHRGGVFWVLLITGRLCRRINRKHWWYSPAPTVLYRLWAHGVVMELSGDIFTIETAHDEVHVFLGH